MFSRGSRRWLRPLCRGVLPGGPPLLPPPPLGRLLHLSSPSPSTSSMAKSFKEQGFVSGYKIMSEEEMSVVREKINRLEASRPDGAFPAQDDSLHFEYRFLAELATNETLLDGLQQVLGEDLVLIGTSIFSKYPAGAGTGAGAGEEEALEQDGAAFVGWHQDLKYWGLSSPVEGEGEEQVKEVNVWIAVDQCDESNGAMRFLPRSHLGGFVPHVRTPRSERRGNILMDGQEVELTPEEEGATVANVLRPGECSMHDGFLIHGSPPNRSRDRRRCGFTCQFVTPCVSVERLRYENEYEDDFRVPVLVRGRDRVGAIKYAKTREQMMQEATKDF